MKLSHLFNSFRKRLATGAIVALAVALPVATSAASTVAITADTTVANASTSGSWAKTASAAYNEVVAVQVVYNNTEEAGSSKVANNLRVKINIPMTAGINQAITTKTSSDNSNTVNGSTNVTLNRADAYLQYIPGTATWKHANFANGPLTVTQKVSDDVVTNPNGLVLENENPCQAGSVVVQARVMTPGVNITKTVEKATESNNFTHANTANPGDTLKYKIRVENTGNSTEKNVQIFDKLPKGLTLVPGTTYLVTSAFPNGKLISDTIAQGGVIAGDAAPGGVAYVVFNAKIDSGEQLTCGENTLTNTAIAQPYGMQQYVDTAVTTVNKTCTPESKPPVYSCDAFNVILGDRKVTVDNSFAYTAKNGAEFKNVVINWGDNSTPLTTNTPKGQSYTYKDYGTYTITATVHFTVNKKDVISTNGCSKTVTFTKPGTPTTPTPPTVTPPTQLPNTGAGDVIGIAAAAMVAGTIGYRLLLSRRLARRS